VSGTVDFEVETVYQDLSKLSIGREQDCPAKESLRLPELYNCGMLPESIIFFIEG